MGAAHAGFDPAPGDRRGARHRRGGGARLVAGRGGGLAQGLFGLHRLGDELARPRRRGRAELGLLPAHIVRAEAPRHGQRRRLRARPQQILGADDSGGRGGAHRPPVAVDREGGALMETETPIAQGRGLGSAREGAGHWWQERTSSVAALMLYAWLGVSLVRLGRLDYGTVRE